MESEALNSNSLTKGTLINKKNIIKYTKIIVVFSCEQ